MKRKEEELRAYVVRLRKYVKEQDKQLMSKEEDIAEKARTIACLEKNEQKRGGIIRKLEGLR